MNILVDFAALFGLDVFSLGALVVMVAIMVIAALFYRVVSRTELFKQLEQHWDALDDFIFLMIDAAENFIGYDEGHWADVALEREELGEEHIDARMLFVLDRAERWIEARSGFDVEFEELFIRAELLFRQWNSAQIEE